VEEQTNTLIKNMLTTGANENVAALLAQAGENAQAIDAMTQAAGESMAARQQATTTAILQAATGITRLEAGLGRVAGFMAHKEMSERIKQEADEDLREGRELFRQNERIKRAGVPAGF
jgi:hypothetical protein